MNNNICPICSTPLQCQWYENQPIWVCSQCQSDNQNSSDNSQSEQIALLQKVEQLEQVNRLKDEFLAIVSHELRTPLTAILCWSKLLQAQPADQNKTRRGLETIERNATLQKSLIEDLLDLAKIVKGTAKINRTSLNLIPVIRSAIDTVTPAAQAKEITIETNLNPFAGQIQGDLVRLQQILLNLLSNAIKFTPEGGKVTIQLTPADREQLPAMLNPGVETRYYAQIDVIDTGTGIDPDFLPFIFDYFRQGDSSDSRQHGGLGLGLAIVQELVELHGGKVMANSAGIGQGSTVSLWLPRVASISHTKHNCHQDRSSTPHAPLELLQGYVAYYLSRGKHLFSPQQGRISFEGQVYQYQGYSFSFEYFWKQLQGRPDFDRISLEGEIYCFRDFLNGNCTVGECARCQLPIPVPEGAAYDVPNCTLCDDDFFWDETLEQKEEEEEVTRVLILGLPPVADYKMLEELFALNGFDVLYISSPAEVNSHLFLRLGIDIVLIGAASSEYEAKTWAQQLRQYPQLETVPIVALTAEADTCLPWVERTLDSQDYLLMPLGGEWLAQNLEKMRNIQPQVTEKETVHWFPR
jgi:signal transduction histidine kinase